MAREQGADARHALAGAILPLADAHGAFIGIAQRNGFVIRVEGKRNAAARPIGPGSGRQGTSGAGAAHNFAPLGFGPFPGFGGFVVHRGFSCLQSNGMLHP